MSTPVGTRSPSLRATRGDYTLRRGGRRFSVRHRSGDIDIFRKFYAYGYYNLPEEIQARLGSLARPVDVLDLGANVGFFEMFTRERLTSVA